MIFVELVLNWLFATFALYFHLVESVGDECPEVFGGLEGVLSTRGTTGIIHQPALHTFFAE